jgi:hypothetical protein
MSNHELCHTTLNGLKEYTGFHSLSKAPPNMLANALAARQKFCDARPQVVLDVCGSVCVIALKIHMDVSHCMYASFFLAKISLEDAIGVHAFAPPLEALACVRPMALLSGVHCLSPVGTVNSVTTLKVKARK